MRPGALLVNTSRGAGRRRRRGARGAARAAGSAAPRSTCCRRSRRRSRRRSAPNLIVTPHAAYYSEAAERRAVEAAVAAVREVLGRARLPGVRQRRGVDDLEVGAGDPPERVQVVVRPVRVRRAADVPVRAVVGEDHPVGLQRLEHDARLPREAGDVDVRLQPDAQAHRRQRRVVRARRVVPRRVDVRLPRPLGREAQRVVDHAARDLVVAREPREDRQPRRVGRTSSPPAAARSSAGSRSRRSPPSSRRPTSGRARTARRACTRPCRAAARAGRRPTRGRPRCAPSSESDTGPLSDSSA